MGLLHCKPRPVPPGPPARPGADGQAQNAQGLDHLEPGRVHRRRVLEWAFGLRLTWGVPDSAAVLAPFFWLQAVQARPRLLVRVGAPRILGRMWSHSERIFIL